jgi:hypothetical protein
LQAARKKNDMNNILRRITNNDIQNGTFVIPEGVTKISVRAFEYCTSLASIIIPDSVTEIGEDAFDWCKNLKKVSLPKKVRLGIGVFRGCHPDLEIEYRD